MLIHPCSVLPQDFSFITHAKKVSNQAFFGGGLFTWTTEYCKTSRDRETDHSAIALAQKSLSTLQKTAACTMSGQLVEASLLWIKKISSITQRSRCKILDTRV